MNMLKYLRHLCINFIIPHTLIFLFINHLPFPTIPDKSTYTTLLAILQSRWNQDSYSRIEKVENYQLLIVP